jgi:Asp/Glu/hydantoin racemase
MDRRTGTLGRQRIVVINSNSTQRVTDEFDAALAPLRFADGPVLECVTLGEGPPGVESQRAADELIPHQNRLIEREDESADAFVIACFSDPGLRSAREVTAKPVIGICEAAMTAALNLGGRIGVLSILESAVRRHRRVFAEMGIAERIAGDIPLNRKVSELANDAEVLSLVLEAGGRLKNQLGAEVVVLGGAAFANYRTRMEAALGMPVIEPVQAGVAMAIAAVRLGWRTSLAGG